MLKKFLYSFAIIIAASGFILGQTPQKATDTIIVLPFENTTNQAEFNWVGESFALSLSELLNVPGLNVITNSERKIMQQRLRIPLSTLPSLATALKLARESGATLLIAGRYSIVPAEGDTAATLNVVAKIIRVNEGRFLNEELPDGRRVTRDINLNDALANLQTMQGQVAYQILYQRDKALPFSQNQLIETASKIPSRAFEAYIKGMLTPTPEVREIYFKNAMRLYAEAIPDGIYPDAALELGHLHLNQNQTGDALYAFEQVVNANLQCKERNAGGSGGMPCNDESFAEASFYIGLIHWQERDYEQALAVLRPLADDLQLTSVYNTLGSIAVQASRAENKNEQRAAALLNEGRELLKKASESAPEDTDVRFNYAVALFLNGNRVDAAEELRKVIGSGSDGEAFYVLSKALAELKDPEAAEFDNQARIMLASGNRYAALETEWQRSETIENVKLRVKQPARKDFVSVVLSRKNAPPTIAAPSETDRLLSEARAHYKEGRDDEAMAVLRRVLAGEPMSAQSYLILGKIHLRRGDLEQAISSLKTALFWDNRLVDAHVSLGRIYLERGECLYVKNYAASAAEIDRENQDVIALQRQAERCSK